MIPSLAAMEAEHPDECDRKQFLRNLGNSSKRLKSVFYFLWCTQVNILKNLYWFSSRVIGSEPSYSNPKWQRLPQAGCCGLMFMCGGCPRRPIRCFCFLCSVIYKRRYTHTHARYTTEVPSELLRNFYSQKHNILKLLRGFESDDFITVYVGGSTS